MSDRGLTRRQPLALVGAIATRWSFEATLATASSIASVAAAPVSRTLEEPDRRTAPSREFLTVEATSTITRQRHASRGTDADD